MNVTSKNGLPIHMMVAGSPRPEGEPLQYIVASNGAFLALEAEWVKAIVPTKEIPADLWKIENKDVWIYEDQPGTFKKVPDLEPIQKRAVFRLPKMPAEVFARIAHFFKLVDDKHKTEVAVLLHYGPEKGWVVTVPAQTVRAAHVDYKIGVGDRVPGCRIVGTAHSHVRMSAHHSGTDVSDEAEIDGLHITIGMVDETPCFDIDAELTIRGERFPIDPELFAEGVETNPEKLLKPNKWSTPSHLVTVPMPEVPAEWFKRVKIGKGWSGGGNWSGHGAYGNYGGEGEWH